MPRKCVCTNPKCDKDVERFAFALGRHWKDDTLRSILSGLRPKADRDDIEKYFLRAMTKPDAARVSSRHFFWHTLAWSPGDRPTLVFKDGAVRTNGRRTCSIRIDRRTRANQSSTRLVLNVYHRARRVCARRRRHGSRFRIFQI